MRYEESRTKIQSYQKQLKSDVNKWKSIDNELTSFVDVQNINEYDQRQYQTNPNHADNSEIIRGSSNSSISYFENMKKSSQHNVSRRNNNPNKNKEKMMLLTDTSLNLDKNFYNANERNYYENEEIPHSDYHRNFSPHIKSDNDKENYMSPNKNRDTARIGKFNLELKQNIEKSIKKGDIKLSSCPVIFTDEEVETSPEAKREGFVLRDKFNRQYVINE